MTKCDFCVHSDPKKGCDWSIAESVRTTYCEEAIQRMEAALKILAAERGKNNS